LIACIAVDIGDQRATIERQMVVDGQRADRSYCSGRYASASVSDHSAIDGACTGKGTGIHDHVVACCTIDERTRQIYRSSVNRGNTGVGIRVT
jgi:hypothetical protein